MKYVLALLLVGLPTAAVAQTEPVPDDRNVELQLFEPAVGTHAYLTVSGAEVMSKGQFQLGLGVNYMTHPLSVYTVDAMDGLESRSQVVDSIFSGNLIFAYGLANNLQAGINLPVILSMTGDGLDSSTGMPEAGGLSVNGLGDARIELAWRAYDNESLVVAVIPAMTVPTSLNLGGDTDAFLGDDLPTFRPRGAVELTGDRFSAAANLGVILRKTRYLYSSEIGQQITYGVAAALHVTRRFDILAEVFGRKGFANDLDESPLEGDLAVKIGATPALSILLGGGTGIIQGFGAPEARVFASVSWAPDFRDNDGDGLSNMADRCPNQAEDKDKYKDDDGCPEVDNDDDGVADAQDRCPLEREDLDGFADEDGCPDGDNDADGIADEKDGCPEEAEDKLPPRADDGCPQSRGDSDGDNVSDDKDKCPTDFEDLDGFQDDDGCPDPDNDGDAALDRDDKCPEAAEDKDGFQDDDGCPDRDDDGDGVADAADRCPKERETINGVKDDDGCPDRGGKVLASLQGNRVVLAAAVAFDGTRVRSKSQDALDQAASHMKTRADVGKWKVAVVAPKADEAQGRAEAVKAHLVKRGVPADAIEATGGTEGAAGVAIVATQGLDGNPIGNAPAEEPAIEIEPPQ